MRLTKLPLTLVPLFLMVLIGCASSSQINQDAEQAAFITLLGEDTLAVERFRRTPAGIEADVVLRAPQTTVTHYTLDLDEAGSFRRYEATAHVPGAPGEGAPLRREVVVPMGDSLQVSVTEEGATSVRTIPGDRHALPFIDMVHWPFELVVERGQASGQESMTQPLFTNRGILSFAVGTEEDGSMTLTHPFRGTMDVEVDPEGRLLSLDAGATTRKLSVTRVPDVDVEALSRRFAALDAAGSAFGPLSGRGETTAQVHGATITVDYGRPAKRGREIFGALVPWGELWRTGANQATHFGTDRDLMVGDLRVPAGRYTLYTIPEPDGGTLIINRQTGQGGTTYDEAQDLGRVDMTISALPEPVELFTVEVEETDAGGSFKLQWDQTEFAVPITVVQ